VLSPLLGNVYLHNVLDLWIERDVKPRLLGRCVLVRYADDFVLALEKQDDAERVMEVLHKRMEKFGLTLHPEKTRLFAFTPPRGDDVGKGSATFDLLGFTLYWRRTRRGIWAMWCKTRRARVSRAIRTAADWCRRHRHLPVKEQHAALVRRVQGHINYFGQIEIWFSILARRVLNRSSFLSTTEANSAILAFIVYFNTILAKPFRWTYTGRALTA
jgi:hypothetical protein